MTLEKRIADLEALRERSLEGGGRGPHRAPARGGKADGARAGRAPARSGQLLRDRSLRRPPLARLRDGEDAGARATASSAGRARIDGRPVYVFAQDFTVFGGSLSETNAEKICKVMDLAVQNGAPIIGLNDSGGARIQEGVVSLAGILARLPAQHAGLRRRAADLRDSRSLRGRRRLLSGDHRLRLHDREDLVPLRDGSRRHQDRHPRGGHEGRPRAARGPIRRFRASPTSSAPGRRRRARSGSASSSPIFPSNNIDDPPRRESRRARRGRPGPQPVHPGGAQQALRHGRSSSARSPTTASFSKCTPASRATCSSASSASAGRSIGVVANQPMHLAGVLDIDASVKGARFVRFCDAFNIPLLVFEDVPGFLPGNAAGVRRDHPARRQAALRVRRGDRPESLRHHAQGLRRRLLRHARRRTSRPTSTSRTRRPRSR